MKKIFLSILVLFLIACDNSEKNVAQNVKPTIKIGVVTSLSGKFAKVPAIKYLERLYKRNEFLIASHHPLRETLI